MDRRLQQLIDALEGERGPYWLPDEVAVPGTFADERPLWISYVEGFHDAALEHSVKEAIKWRRTDQQWVAYHAGYEDGVAWREAAAERSH